MRNVRKEQQEKREGAVTIVAVRSDLDREKGDFMK